MTSLFRSTLRRSPLRFRRLVWQLYYKFSLAVPDRSELGTPDGSKIVVAGMFSTASGLGEWARSTYASLVDAGYQVTAVDLSPLLAPLDYECSIPLEAFPEDKTGTLILHVNAPEVPTCLHALGLKRGKSWRVIAAWAWELDVFPPGWDHAFPFISEVWALSEFAAKAFLKHPKSPTVKVLPIAVRPPRAANSKVARPVERPFTVLVLADALSSLSRKNPMGAIEAFRMAFGNDEACRLKVKVRNLDPKVPGSQDLLSAVEGASNISMLNQTLSKSEHAKMIAAADVLISMHRAEGFGLGLAEAMMSNVPVVATGWSGNLTFCDAESTALVSYELVPVSDPSGHYNIEGAVWAEPDIKGASDALKCLRDDPTHARDLAARGKDKVIATCGVHRIQQLITNLLRTP